ncbi:hypothetical protein Patl1_16684 [Pistacia atlantica]|uniref:Uncharacterized protein n=1 Tax=Pistacia atlantica TaxID=434234 RepID=A0ACC1BB43_9ROSI|nr:hypothetical protein Patl1_16684 [Pistacia atlantica]
MGVAAISPQWIQKDLANPEPILLSSSKPELDVQSAPKHVSSTGNSSRSKELDSGSPVPSSTSPASQVTHESSIYDLPSTQSPPLQVMDRSGGYDPLRIPSTVFERKSSTPLDWSAASNESLFSLHIGNNSFSKDHVFMLGGEVLKSGELSKSGEFVTFSPISPAPVEETEGKSQELEKSEEIGESDDSIKVSTIDTAVDQSMEKGPPAKGARSSFNFSTHSNESARSFAFPIVENNNNESAGVASPCCRSCRGKRCAWPSCYSSDCSCTFCYCSLPSCYLLWPSCYCSDCSWAFCHCWNCSLKKMVLSLFHSYHMFILTEGPGGSSAKPEVEKNPNKQLADKIASTSSACCCVTCSSCHPCCFSSRFLHCC